MIKKNGYTLHLMEYPNSKCVCWYAGHAYFTAERRQKGSLYKFIFSHVGGRLFWNPYVI